LPRSRAADHELADVALARRDRGERARRGVEVVPAIDHHSLGALGYQAVEAASGSEAIEIYRRRHHEIRAVVLDMMMPGLTGRATYLALREIDPTIPVLLMSGHTMDEHVQEMKAQRLAGGLAPASCASTAASRYRNGRAGSAASLPPGGRDPRAVGARTSPRS
jgi:CheY-like chemotaxis protein